MERFWSKVEKTKDCWRWTASLDTHGYGQIGVNGSLKLAHRLSWVFAHGNIPHGMCVCHTCDNPACVNPAHLFLGSHKDNMSDRRAKGKYQSKLTEADVLQIRADYRPKDKSRNQSALAKKYGVNHVTIWLILNRKTWAHI